MTPQRFFLTDDDWLVEEQKWNRRYAVEERSRRNKTVWGVTFAGKDRCIVINDIVELRLDAETFNQAAEMSVRAVNEQWPTARLLNALHYRGCINVPGWKPFVW